MKITSLRSWKHKVNNDQYVHCQASVHLNLVDLLQFTERKVTTTYQFSHAACIRLELKYFKLPRTTLLII